MKTSLFCHHKESHQISNHSFTKVRQRPGRRGAWQREQEWVGEWANDLQLPGIRSHRQPISSWWRHLRRGKRKIPWKRFRLHLRSASALRFPPLWFRSLLRSCSNIKWEIVTNQFDWRQLWIMIGTHLKVYLPDSVSCSWLCLTILMGSASCGRAAATAKNTASITICKFNDARLNCKPFELSIVGVYLNVCYYLIILAKNVLPISCW